MKLISYEYAERRSVGAVIGDGVVDIGKRLGVNSLRELITREKLAAVREYADAVPDYTLAQIKLLPPVTDPLHIYCVGVNYSDHLKEVRDAGISRPEAKYPMLFTRFADTFVAHGEGMEIPKVSDQLDYEAELAIVIGKSGRYIIEDQALEHVAGYSCFNDGSVRDWQYHTTQITPGKNFSKTGGFGPWLITADEIPDPSNLDIELVLNGKTLQQSNTRYLIYSLPRIISYASSMVALKPGDVIATGTPGGVGFSRKPPIFMKPGDVCEVRIEKVGVLRNTIEKALA